MTQTGKENETFDFGDMLGYKHLIGNRGCSAGWCDGGSNYPITCDCGGLIHANFGDEDSDCNYWLYTKCDRCGESER